MKKFTALCLLVCLMLTLLPGCSTDKADVWDGTSANAFAGGDGTEASPFTIAKASQLAFLAAEINAGKDYTGKHFSLTRDLDLAMLDWTPIGNGTHSFSGSFDGNGHTITNLRIKSGASYTAITAAGHHARYASGGLFGTCHNAVIKRLSIDIANISAPITDGHFMIMSGVLAGTIQADAHTEISDITVSNATMTVQCEQDTLPANLRIGGIIGYLYSSKEATCTMSRLQADVQVSLEHGRAADNHVGGLVGFLHAKSLCDVKNCASYVSVAVDTENCYATGHYFGAFGALSSVYHNNTISVSNVFSRVTVNKIHDYFHGYSAYTANAIAGELDTGYRESGGYQFKNLYGYVEQLDKESGKKEAAMQLYYISYPDYPGCTAVSCLGCKVLPEEHGFDESFWDLRDPAAPMLK